MVDADIYPEFAGCRRSSWLRHGFRLHIGQNWALVQRDPKFRALEAPEAKSQSPMFSWFLGLGLGLTLTYLET